MPPKAGLLTQARGLRGILSHNPCGIARRICKGERADDNDQRNEAHAGKRRADGETVQATRLRARGPDHSIGACSSTSWVSFQIVAPPCSSASTIVTARR